MKHSKAILIAIAFIVCLATNADGYNLKEYEKFVDKFLNKPQYKIDFSNNLKRLVEKEPYYFDYSPFKSDKSLTFDCNTQTLAKGFDVPKSVHELRPGDINVVAAMGDSITAACGADADTVIGLMTEYRERSWSIGGRDDLEQIVTMPNILKKFNPQLKGASMRNNLVTNGKEG
jgi:hypothetical protein